MEKTAISLLVCVDLIIVKGCGEIASPWVSSGPKLFHSKFKSKWKNSLRNAGVTAFVNINVHFLKQG